MDALVDLVRYPLKSALGEPLVETAVGVAGVDGDRVWACVDPEDGTVGSAKHPRRWGPLLRVRATGAAPAGVVVDVDGQVAAAGTPRCDEVLSERLGRPVRLTRTVPQGPRLHRLLPRHAGLVPDWLAGSAAAGQELVTPVRGAVPGGRFTDFGPVHLVTTGALSRLADRLGRDVSAARFRPNLVVDAAVDPEPGRELRVGEAVLRVVAPTPRCVVPGLVHGEAGPDEELLAVLARHHRRDVLGRGRAACFGTYAEVVVPGRVRVGDAVRLLP